MVHAIRPSGSTQQAPPTEQRQLPTPPRYPPKLISLQEAKRFWADLCGKESSSLHDLTLSEEQSRQFLELLNRLRDTNEYKDRGNILAARVYSLWIALSKDENLLQFTLDRFDEALSSCVDRLILVFDDIEMQKTVIEHVTSDPSEANLRKLGRSLLFYEKVSEFCMTYCERPENQHLDMIEALLKVRLRLKDKLNLPIQTQFMSYGSPITDEEISREGDRILREYDNKDSINTFLAHWEPWQAIVVKSARERKMPNFEQFQEEVKDVSEEVCCISQERMEEPIFYNGRYYDYVNFRAWFVDNGTDPITREPICVEDIRSQAKKFAPDPLLVGREERIITIDAKDVDKLFFFFKHAKSNHKIVVEGDLDFTKIRYSHPWWTVTKFPDHLHVKGDFFYEYGNIESLSLKSLCVDGDFRATYCKNLKGFPEDFEVGGTAVIWGCSELGKLGKRVILRGTIFDIGECPKLAAANFQEEERVEIYIQPTLQLENDFIGSAFYKRLNIKILPSKPGSHPMIFELGPVGRSPPVCSNMSDTDATRINPVTPKPLDSSPVVTFFKNIWVRVQNFFRWFFGLFRR